MTLKQSEHATTERRQPWLKWFPGDWRGDERLRRCGLAARGFWAECIGVMHKATPYGHLLIDGQAPDEKTLAREFATTAGEVRRCLSELGKHGVYSTTPEGVIFSRRMVRDERRRQASIFHRLRNRYRRNIYFIRPLACR